MQSDGEITMRLKLLLLQIRLVINPHIVKASVAEKLVATLTTLEIPGDMLKMVENLNGVEQWYRPMASALLSGKLISRSTKSLQPCKYFLSGESLMVLTTFYFIQWNKSCFRKKMKSSELESNRCYKYFKLITVMNQAR